jgi:hypothetical protein
VKSRLSAFEALLPFRSSRSENLQTSEEVSHMRTLRVLFVLPLLAVASFQAKAEDFTAVTVHLPYTVMAGDQQLTPGDYLIQPVSGRADIFAIYKDGTAFETFVSAVHTERTTPAPKTELVLRGDGHDYVLDQMWIGGEGRGFEFLSPQSAKSRAHERRITVIGVKKAV